MESVRGSSASHTEAVKSIEGFVAEHLPSLLKPANDSWQASDFLPDSAHPDWFVQVRDLREKAAALPDDLLVVLVGDMVTEEALPTYQTWINRLAGITDQTGASDTPWARWSRGWTAEENRHGDLLNRYLYLSGRVDMRAVEVTVHHLLNRGFDPKTDNDPYLGFVYTAFQERATKISHRNVATLARRVGEDCLHKICGFIAGDESRHEQAYKLFMQKIFDIDPREAVCAFAAMMKRKIVMPAVLMRDAVEENLFVHFSRVAQRSGVYTVQDYADIIENLVECWKVSALGGLSDIAAEAQDYLCTLPRRFRALSERTLTGEPARFSWIYGRSVP